MKQTFCKGLFYFRIVQIYFLESSESICRNRIVSKPDKPKNTTAKAESRFLRFFPNHINRKQSIAKAEIERKFFIFVTGLQNLDF